MRVFLAGSSGRLGSLIAASLTSRSISWTPLTTPEEQWNFADLRKSLDQNGPQAKNIGIVDVTLPAGTEALCRNLLALPPELCRQVRFLVIGATGHNPEQITLMHSLAARIPVVLVSNFSRGVYLMRELLGAKTRSGLTVAELAKSVGFDLGMLEVHHRRKIDAPSGTAVTLASAAGINREKIASLRVGDVVGEHSILACAEAEELRLTHVAQNRSIFALGACELITRLSVNETAPGFYGFADILNLTQSSATA
jgi:4-hydroxy-tetrahydrodipicolinate reductase